MAELVMLFLVLCMLILCLSALYYRWRILWHGFIVDRTFLGNGLEMLVCPKHSVFSNYPCGLGLTFQMTVHFVSCEDHQENIYSVFSKLIHQLTGPRYSRMSSFWQIWNTFLDLDLTFNLSKTTGHSPTCLLCSLEVTQERYNIRNGMGGHC